MFKALITDANTPFDNVNNRIFEGKVESKFAENFDENYHTLSHLDAGVNVSDWDRCVEWHLGADSRAVSDQSHRSSTLGVVDND